MKREQVEMISLEELVSSDHLYRKYLELIDFRKLSVFLNPDYAMENVDLLDLFAIKEL